ncbi:TPA: hypothetical protein ACYLN4_003303 [Burkholderia lata]|nr:hypothetical protein [Burkholderia aenigmatica]
MTMTRQLEVPLTSIALSQAGSARSARSALPLAPVCMIGLIGGI